MINLKDATISKPSFVKLADFELSSDISDWNEDILKHFYEEVNFLPKEVGVNVIIKSVDENSGTAKGSVVVFFNGKQINFPVIVKDHKLSPFDVFIKKEGTEDCYYPSTEEEVGKALTSDSIGTLENRWDQAKGKQQLKAPGGIMPKQSINLYEASEESVYPPFAKMSGWRELSKKEDIEKLAETLVGMPDVGAAFHDNTGDLVSSVVQLKDYQREENTPNQHRRGKIDLNHVLKAKKALTAIDSDFIDTSKFVPLTPPSVAEARLYEYPSMEDFLESGDNMAERFMATKIGRPVIGIVVDLVDKERNSCEPCCISSSPSGDELEKLKAARNRRDQVFIALDGKCYSEFVDYNKTGIGFYGSKILNAPDSVEKAVKMLSLSTTDDFINLNRENKMDGADKSFAGFNTMHQGKVSGVTSHYIENEYGNCNHNLSGSGLFVLYGAGSAYEAEKFGGNFKKFMVNNSHVYVSKDNVLIPANVASIQKVSSVQDPVYKMIVGKTHNIYLFPEKALIINRGFMRELSREEFMRPNLSVQKIYEESNISKVAMCVMTDGNDIGWKIAGKPFDAMKKIAGVNSQLLNTNEAKAALAVMGMDKTTSDRAMFSALQKFADYTEKDKNIIIYGVNSDYINPNAFDGHEKTARINGLMKEIAYGLRRDLVKEASVLTNPEAVDVILSLNFINEESLKHYVENIDKMEVVLSELAQLLIASRMGLEELDETAIKNSMTGLSEVISGLKNVRISLK